MTRRNLLDLNVLIALSEPAHCHYPMAAEWLDTSSKGNWGVCPLTEIGFVRVTTSPSFRPVPRSHQQASAILAEFANRPGYRYWPMTESWAALTAPFGDRIFGHQQVTDAYLLGLAIREDGVLVTFDRGLRFLAGAEFSRNLFVIQ